VGEILSEIPSPRTREHKGRRDIGDHHLHICTAADAPRARQLLNGPCREGSVFLVCGKSSLPVVGGARVPTVPLVNAARTCLQQVIGPGRSLAVRRAHADICSRCGNACRSEQARIARHNRIAIKKARKIAFGAEYARAALRRTRPIQIGPGKRPLGFDRDRISTRLPDQMGSEYKRTVESHCA
jgi:hypothetical protein